MHRSIIIYLLMLLTILPLSQVAYSEEKELTPSEEYFLLGDYDNIYMSNLKAAQGSPKKAYLPLLIASDISKQFLSKSDLGMDELKELSTNTNLSPDSKNLVIQMLADIYSAKGFEYQATELREQTGIIPSWRISGAFGEYEQASFYQKFPPEEDIDFSIFMKGLGKDVTWRLLSENACLNDFTPYKWISPQRGVLYLYTQFELKSPQEVVLEKSGSGAFSFWVDGKKCGGADFMQEEIGQTQRFKSHKVLETGWHRLLVKLYSPETNSPNVFRLLTANFEPIPEINFNLKDLKGQNQFGQDRWDRIEPNISDYSKIEQALYFQYMKEYDKALTLWQEAIVEKPQNAAIRIYYAACAGQAQNILPGPMRSSIVQRESLKAIELDPEAVAAFFILGEHNRQNDNYRGANEYFSKALKINPTAIMIHGARIRMALQNDWSGEIVAWMNKLEELYPDSYLLFLLKSIYNNSTGSIHEAANNLNSALLLDRSNLAVANDCIKSYFASGESEKALSTWQRLPSYYQERADMLLLYSEILSRLGEFDKAITALKRSIQAVGTDPSILRIQGDVLFTSKEYDSAKEAYKQSLELDSGNFSLRRLLMSLENKDYNFWKMYAINPMTKIEEFSNSNQPHYGSTARLIDQTVLTIYNGGGYSNYTHELQTVLTDSGVDKAAIVDTYGELLQARTILPERGISLEPIILKGEKNITMPAVSPGAVIEHTYLNENSTPPDRKLRFPKWYFRSPNSQESFLFSQYVVRVPKGVDFAYATRNLGEKVEFTTTEDEDGTKEFVWTGIDMPEAIHEEGSPAISSTLPYVAVASKQSWDDVHKSMITTYLGKTIPTTKIRAKVAELINGATTTNEKISRIYEYTNKEITQTSSRAPASHIFLQRAGNRKNLLLSMLSAAGIEAELIAARPPANILFDPIWKLPSDNNFVDYLIRAIGDNGEYIWLDPRARYAGAGEIGEDFCGGTGFVLGLEKSEFITIPEAPESRYTIQNKRNYTFDDKLTKISGSIEYSGTRGWEFKENLTDLNDELRLGVVENILTESIFGVKIDTFTLPNLTASGTSFTVDYEASVEDFLRENTDGAYGIPLALSKIKMLPSKDVNNRRTPYHLSNFLAGHDKFIYNLPKGASVKKLPEDSIIRSKFGYYTLMLSLENNKIILERKYNFQPQTISLNDWKDYYNLSGEIQQIENTHIWFEKQ